MNTPVLKVLFSGGGSVGHLAPSIAVCEVLKKKHGGVRELFVCSFKRDDRSFLKSQNVKYVPIFSARTNSIIRLTMFPILFPLGLLEALFILMFFRPHVIFSKGGYVSVPISLMGWMLMKPIVLHESDRVMGRANIFLLKFAKHLCIGTPEREVANSEVMTRRNIQISATGNPVRNKLLTGTVDGGRRVTKFSGKRPVLLVMGGSQGAKVLNEAIWQHIEELTSICDVIHLTGRGKSNSIIKHGRYIQQDVRFEELEQILAIADIVISRAGAGAIAEFAALGKATILVPLPKLAHNHQEENAQLLKAARAVLVLDQERLEDSLVSTVKSLVEDVGKRERLATQLHAFADMDAGERIANILIAESG